MRTKFSKIAFSATLGFVLIFTFSCSGGDDSGGGDPNGGLSSSGGGTFSRSSSSGTSSQSSSGGGSDKGNDISKYKIKRIGSQTWMSENLNYAVAGSKCGTDNGGLSDANTTICNKYGRLYTWVTAMGIDAKYNEEEWGGSDVKHQGICPNGWHIPSNDDWEELINYVESENSCIACAGKHLKSKSGWNEGGNGLDTHGFSALPGGRGNSGGFFSDVGNNGGWWSASQDDSNFASYRGMLYFSEYVSWISYNKLSLFSVRCVQDN